MTMEIVDYPVGKITPYENNPRDNDGAVEAVANSIREFGWQQPIVVDEDGVIVVGHTRYKAALEMGLETVPVKVAHGLTEEQCRAYRLADNRTHDLSGWLDAMLQEELDAIEMDMEPFGFEPSDIDLGGMLDDGGRGDEVPDVEDVEPTVKRGQVWRLGDHVLMCGDSTSREDVERLMGGTRAEMCFTSPPYNAGQMNLPASEERGGKVQKSTEAKYMKPEQTMSDEAYGEFLVQSVETALEWCDEAFYNIGVIAGSKGGIIVLLDALKGRFKDVAYWLKSNPTPVISNTIASAIEPVFIFGKNGTRAFRKDIGHFTGVVEGPNAGNTNDFTEIHKATFPVYLPTRMVETFTNPGETVLDLFGGTGTTMIACEQTGRRCRMMELDPRYCDVIIKRWEDLTGRKAELMES